MKHLILLAIILTASVCYAKSPVIVYDPNTITESLTDPNYVSITITVEITREQYAAMQYMGMSLLDVVNRSNIEAVLDRLILKAKARIVEAWTLSELLAIKKEE